MFDFAISRNQQQRPTKRSFACLIASILAHLCLVLILLHFPELLRGGMYHRFNPVSFLTNALEPDAKDKDEEKDWRTVTVLRTPMIEPPADILRKYLHNQEEKGTAALPPVVVQFSKEEKAALQHMPPVPKVREEAKSPVIVPPPSTAGAAGGAQSQSGKSVENSSGSAAVQIDTSTGKKAVIAPPAPSQSSKTETASNTAPASIPNGIKAPANSSQPSSDLKVFEDEKKAIQTPGSGLFDTKGFPLGEYSALIKERIKGNWEIPSNLKNSQGHTTIIFRIGKDGRFMDARIEPATSSGNNSLNLAALAAILKSNPFPPLPKGFPGNDVGAKFILSYNEP